MKQILLASVLSLLVVVGAAGCGSATTSGDSAAVEARIARESAAAAKSARQDERIKQLEAAASKAKTAKPARIRTVTTPAPAPAPQAEPEAIPASSQSDDADDWPGGSGQTVVLASVASESQARRVQRQASDAGLDAGVLYSSDYSSLRPGYWVAFSGKFDSTEAASQRQSRARSVGFGDAYARFVSR